MKKVLLLYASHDNLGLIWALKKLNYYIIVTGYTHGLIGEKHVDKYIPADYSDKELILKIARDEKIDRICANCNDHGAITAAYVAEILNLPGYDSYETIMTLHNKGMFKQFAMQHDILTPKADYFTKSSEAKIQLKNYTYPLIIKPVDCSGGVGVCRANNITEATKAVDVAFEKSRMGTIIIERFFEGTQHGFCTFLINQKVVAISSNNEYAFENLYRVEIDTFPADNYNEVKDILISQIEKMAGILSLKDGIFHLQYIMSNNTPYIIEVMRRTVGNMYWLLADRLNCFDWSYWEARARLGLSCEHFPVHTEQEGYYAYKTLYAKYNGSFLSVNVPAEYEKHIFHSIILKDKGYNITNYKTDLIGILFFAFSSKDEMMNVLIENYNGNLVETE
ncbi:MAG: ATP-grasp domain-containing protein [Defluviitaleaceae bacterium]|nr:ATP-grasp domain-containing protein [Defluviitaleaceae bacterium]